MERNVATLIGIQNDLTGLSGICISERSSYCLVRDRQSDAMIEADRRCSEVFLSRSMQMVGQ